MSHVIDKLKFGVPADAIVMACPPDVNPDDDSVRYYGGLLVCESASFEWRRRIVACVNACCGSSTDWLDFIVSEEYSDEFGGPMPFETRHGEILRMSLGFMVERDQRKKQRDELLEALEIMIIGACAVGVPHQGERKVLQDAVDHARAAIAKATGKEA